MSRKWVWKWREHIRGEEHGGGSVRRGSVGTWWGTGTRWWDCMDVMDLVRKGGIVDDILYLGCAVREKLPWSREAKRSSPNAMLMSDSLSSDGPGISM